MATTSARADRDAVGRKRTTHCLLADPEPQPHVQQRQAAVVHLDRFGEVALIETAPAHRDRPADEVRRRCAAMNAEPLTEFHKRRTRLVQGGQLVDLRRAQKGLSHPNCTHHPPS